VTPEHLSGKGYFHQAADFELHVPFDEIVDPQVEIAKLKKDIDGLQKAVISKEKQLGNETFRSRAPEMIVKGLEATLSEQRIEMQKLRERLSQIEKES
jgi:valyl-tRNA synthetase